jgi:hypothetical protein
MPLHGAIAHTSHCTSLAANKPKSLCNRGYPLSLNSGTTSTILCDIPGTLIRRELQKSFEQTAQNIRKYTHLHQAVSCLLLRQVQFLTRTFLCIANHMPESAAAL